MFTALAHLAERRARWVVAVAVVLFAAGGALSSGVADKLDPYGADDPDTESVRADERLEQAGYREPGVVVLVSDADVESAATRRRVEGLAAELGAREDVASVTGFYDTGDPGFVSSDGTKTYLLVGLTATDDGGEQDAAESIIAAYEEEPDLNFGGFTVAELQVNEQTESDLQRAELLAFPLLLLLAFLFFRSLVAAALPLMVGAIAIVGTLIILRIAAELASISIFALNLTTGLGLGLAIDYSLFIVSRYREEIAKDGPGEAAMRRTMATAGRTVVFSSLTVSAALASLLVFPQRFLYSMGLGGSMVALLGALVALTVLPAVLTLLGDRVNALSPAFLQRRAAREARPEQEGFWYRLSQLVARRPLPIATAATIGLLVLGIPFLGATFTQPDAQILPTDKTARQVDDVIRAEFPPFRDSPIILALDGVGSKATERLAERVEASKGVAGVNPPRELGGGLTVLEATPSSPAISRSSRTTVRNLRELEVPGEGRVMITGQTAHFVDFQSSLIDHLPLAGGIIVGATLILLFLMTGSAVLPVKALIMNVLNLSAVFGILVLIFQDGRLEGLLDYNSQGALEQTMPILLFAVAFGLSTDYAVFLLSRIKEARDRGAGESECVAAGLERTGRIVTAAALLFAIAIGAFATSEIVFIKQNGIGTALAVLIDASVIRALLVPSLMEMLGRWNWWAPAPLRRLHDRIGIDEAPPPEPELA